MFVLAVNSGSQTLKYKLYKSEAREKSLELVKKGKIVDIGFSKVKNHQEAIVEVMKEIEEFKKDLLVVCHRFVNGGLEFVNPVVVDEKVAKKLEEYNGKAPLHNPYNLEGIKAVLKIMPEVMNIAVFDTCFYKNLPEVAWRYAIGREVADKGNYRRMGFHGISHHYALIKAAKKLGKKEEELNLISIHLGGGSSITAVREGEAVDTSMGFTPMEGLVMMTRSGDIDPGVIIDLADKGMSIEEIDDFLNEGSGLYGLCGRQGMLEVLDNLEDKRTRKAFEIYVYRIKKYIGAYWAILGGCDGLVFTGTVGAGRPETRRAVLLGMDFLKKVPVLVIKTNEERLIAEEGLKLYQSQKAKIKYGQKMGS